MKQPYLQLPLPNLTSGKEEKGQNGVISNSNNSIDQQDKAFHEWYRFVLSYPPHLVRDYIENFGLNDKSRILDPFCGTGTTIVEAKLHGIYGVGLEANPFPHFACSVKLDWTVDPDELWSEAKVIAEHVYGVLQTQGIDDNQPFTDTDIVLRDLNADAKRILIKNSISPMPLHKTLILRDYLKKYEDSRSYRHYLLALGNALVYTIGNLRFGPEVGVGKQKRDVPIVASWLGEVYKMVADLRTMTGQAFPNSIVHLADARKVAEILTPNSIDAVITSPPYPNEKDYTRTTRLESVVLGFFNNINELRDFKKTLVRSNTRGVYKADTDDEWIKEHKTVQRIAHEIEARRIELGKTSGFERQYARVTRLYFGGMARHLAELRSVLRPGAQLAYVVGDQASYLRIMIRTGELLASIAEELGYELVRIDLFRTRFATATKAELREEVVVLRWPGEK